MPQPPKTQESAAPAVVVGGGPAGLMAAQVLAAAGCPVRLYDAMPSVGRKFLLAGKGGLNLTHSEPRPAFDGRYGARAPQVGRWLDAFGPDALRDWAAGLGVETFVGTSGRVFPRDMKAAPLLRAWLARLRKAGVEFHMRQRWRGWDEQGRLLFDAPVAASGGVVLALGGASWPRLGSDGTWVGPLRAAGVDVAALQPANCGFEVAGGWSEFLRERFAGAPLKAVALRFGDVERRGEFVLSDYGVEGSLVYALSAAVRDAIAAQGSATVLLDLLPEHTAERVNAEVARPRGPRSLSTHLKSRLGIDGAKAALLHELLPKETFADAAALARAIKALPLTLVAPRPIDEAISSAGGVRLEALDDALMARSRPGLFCAGEMLDWEAPTGGYLLQASFASGVIAAQGLLTWRKG